MTEQPLWQRQRDAYEAARAAQTDAEYRQMTEGDWSLGAALQPDMAAPEPIRSDDYIRPDGSFVHVRDTRPAEWWLTQHVGPAYQKYLGSFATGHGTPGPSVSWGVAGILDWTDPDERTEGA